MRSEGGDEVNSTAATTIISEKRTLMMMSLRVVITCLLDLLIGELEGLDDLTRKLGRGCSRKLFGQGLALQAAGRYDLGTPWRLVTSVGDGEVLVER